MREHKGDDAWVASIIRYVNAVEELREITDECGEVYDYCTPEIHLVESYRDAAPSQYAYMDDPREWDWRTREYYDKIQRERTRNKHAELQHRKEGNHICIPEFEKDVEILKECGYYDNVPA